MIEEGEDWIASMDVNVVESTLKQTAKLQNFIFLSNDISQIWYCEIIGTDLFTIYVAVEIATNLIGRAIKKIQRPINPIMMCVLSKKDRRTDVGGKGIFALRALFGQLHFC
mgnify:CR=1 FL=1